MSKEQGALSDWQEDYMTASRAYPIATREEHIVPLLRAPFCRAVTYRNPELAFDPSTVTAVNDQQLAQLYWKDANEARGRRASGRKVHVAHLSAEDIRTESDEAGIIIDPDAVQVFTDRCNVIRDMFGRVFDAYTQTEGVVQRGFTLFTPKGGRGRSPELHIDNTVLTVHWAAALATFRVHDGPLSEDVWNALNMTKRKLLDPKNPQDKEKLDEIFKFLTEQAATLDMAENKIGDIMITKGQRCVNLDDPVVRQQVCVHVSSPTIIENGQAGFLMTPQMPS